VVHTGGGHLNDGLPVNGFGFGEVAETRRDTYLS
jgi:hypothetical protein